MTAQQAENGYNVN